MFINSLCVIAQNSTRIRNMIRDVYIDWGN